MPIDGTVFLLALHGTTPTCEAWTVTPAQLSHADTHLAYHVEQDELVLDSCHAKLEVSERPDGYDVAGARWFRTKAACRAAIAHHQRVAMRWCGSDDDALTEEHTPTRRRFDDVLAYGGIMYSEGACNRVRFEATNTTATKLAGTLTYAIIVDGVHGMEEYGYEGTRGDPQLWLLGPGRTMDDGMSSAMGCADEVTPVYFRDHVVVTGNLYFDRPSCQAASARAAYIESWWPRDAQDAGIGHVPLAGGC